MSTGIKDQLVALREYTDGLLVLVGIIMLVTIISAYFTDSTVIAIIATLSTLVVFKVIRISFKLKNLTKD